MDRGDPVAEETGQSRNVVQLLALFLLLLSFFILLNSLSSFETVRARAVLASLNETFATEIRTTADKPYVAIEERPALQRFHDAVRRALLTALPESALSETRGGQVVAASLPIDSLFLPDSAALRPERAEMLAAIAAALKDRPADLRFEGELVLDPAKGDEALTRGRAGSFARRLVELGAPADAVAIGVGASGTGNARLRFAARSLRDGVVDLSAPPAGGKAP